MNESASPITRHAAEVHPVDLDHVPDIRLIACDMDGTLLDDDNAIHADFWPLIHQLHERGIIFCPASGRQYHSLFEHFTPIADELIFIAENGTYVMHKGIELSSDCLSPDAARELVQVFRALKQREADVGAVLCGKRSAYIEGNDTEFLAEVGKYYRRLEMVDDLLAVQDDILKVAIFNPRSSERVSYPAFERFRDTHQVVISGEHWLDVMVPLANKGSGLRHIQQMLHITRDQTMVFGDFLNDLEMMDEATYSFAMANAHPRLKERANFVSPGNTDNGVVRTIKSVLGID
ncbi:MAG: family hydrolase [Proteobacteria bacterium]|nr:family hydrolase [Pseudomonadota bacterium]